MSHSEEYPEASATGPISGPAPLEFQSLDPRVVRYWQVNHLIGSAVLLGLLLVPCAVLSVLIPGGVKWLASAWLMVALIRVGLLYWYPPRAYSAWGYRLDGKVLETRSGIWFRIFRLLPLNRLQHVDLHRGPLERHYGLASLILHTAGTVQSSIVIPGLDADEAARLRDHLATVGGDDGV